jgi:lipopolysaccharide transport system ATP-binding protein
LLKILSRITEPTTGRIQIKGRVASLLEVGTGFHPELTGQENIFLNGAILGMSKAEITRKFDEIVAFAEVEKFLDTPVKRYSSGMYVRLAFAVAAHLEPEILVVDEVLAVGDTQFQKKCMGKMEEEGKKGRTVLFVSHQMAAIQNLCQRAMLLKYGQVITNDKTEVVIDKYIRESATLSHISLAERTDRQGNGDIRFTSVLFQNEKRQNVSSFYSGQNIRFILQYKNNSKKDLKNLHLSIGIDNQIGERITFLSTDLTNKVFVLVPSITNSIEIYVEKLPLTLGRYSFTIYCMVNGIVADWIQNAGFFDVETGDYYGTGKLPPVGQGNFLINHSFTVPEINNIY